MSDAELVAVLVFWVGEKELSQFDMCLGSIAVQMYLAQLPVCSSEAEFLISWGVCAGTKRVGAASNMGVLWPDTSGNRCFQDVLSSSRECLKIPSPDLGRCSSHTLATEVFVGLKC